MQNQQLVVTDNSDPGGAKDTLVNEVAALDDVGDCSVGLVG